jgi:4-hydroxythreonine-4-phosphate dehydrogenase
MGDPAGIGPEIIAKLFHETPSIRAVVIGDETIMQRAIDLVGTGMAIHRISHPSEAVFAPNTIEVITETQLPADLPFGRVDARAGKAAYIYVKRAIDYALQGSISAIVTSPINKEALKLAGIDYPGHTEVLADRIGTSDFTMMLANDELRVVLVTIHLSLADAIKQVSVEAELKAIRLAHEACRRSGIASPRVAVAGLNPHAGENGLFGREDLDIIAPAIALARDEGIDATGPWPGDTIFMRARRGEFDVVVAQYHDQGLIPVKYLGIDHGVNITLGLPFVRTSVDHGTAFDIAGTGKADPRSLQYALTQAEKLNGAAKGSPMPEFIFMLTRQDRTIPDAMTRLKDVLAAGVRHIGFKNVGLPLEDLKLLASAIRQGGAKLYLEVVSLDEASEMEAAKAAVALDVDVLMGGTRPDAVLPVIRNTGIEYFPFPGKIVGHPSVLLGPIEDIVESAKTLAAKEGVHGLDLLAYRFDGDVPELIRQVCGAVSKPVYVAGSIDRYSRICDVIRGQAFGFTVGAAALDGVFPAVEPGLTAQLVAIQKMINQAPILTRSNGQLSHAG